MFNATMIDPADTMAPGLQKLLESTVELSTELLLEASLDGAILKISPAWTRVLGWNESEVRSKTFCGLVHPGDLQRAREELKRATEGDTISAFDVRCRHNEGSYRWISWRVAAHGSTLHGAGRDITAEIDAIAALRGSEEALRRIGKTESVRASASEAHEFNNMLQNIVAALELIQKLIASGRTAETERFILKAIASGQRASALAQRIVGSQSGNALEARPSIDPG